MARNHGRAVSRSFGHMEVGSFVSFWLVGARGCDPIQLRWCQSMWLDGAGQTGHQIRTRGCSMALGGLGGSQRSRRRAPVGGHAVMSVSDIRGCGLCVRGLGNVPQ